MGGLFYTLGEFRERILFLTTESFQEITFTIWGEGKVSETVVSKKFIMNSLLFVKVYSPVCLSIEKIKINGMCSIKISTPQTLTNKFLSNFYFSQYTGEPLW